MSTGPAGDVSFGGGYGMGSYGSEKTADKARGLYYAQQGLPTPDMPGWGSRSENFPGIYGRQGVNWGNLLKYGLRAAPALLLGIMSGNIPLGIGMAAAQMMGLDLQSLLGKFGSIAKSGLEGGQIAAGQIPFMGDVLSLFGRGETPVGVPQPEGGMFSTPSEPSPNIGGATSEAAQLAQVQNAPPQAPSREFDLQTSSFGPNLSRAGFGRSQNAIGTETQAPTGLAAGGMLGADPYELIYFGQRKLKQFPELESGLGVP